MEGERGEVSQARRQMQERCGQRVSSWADTRGRKKRREEERSRGQATEKRMMRKGEGGGGGRVRGRCVGKACDIKRREQFEGAPLFCKRAYRAVYCLLLCSTKECRATTMNAVRSCSLLAVGATGNGGRRR